MRRQMLESFLRKITLVFVVIFFYNSSVFSQESVIFFDYYGVKNIDDGTTLSGNSEEKLTIPCEATSYLSHNNYNLDPHIVSPLGHKTGVTIKYIPKGMIYANDTLIFHLSNAHISSNIYKCWLVFHEYKGIDNDDDGIGEESFDLNHDGYPFGVIIVAESIGEITDSITFRVSQRTPSNAVLYLACAEEGERSLVDDSGVNMDGFDTSYNIVINPDNLYENNTVYNVCNSEDINRNICLTVSAFSCCPSREIPSLEIKTPQCFMDVKCQFSVNMKPTLSIIQMYPELNNLSCRNSKSGLIKCFNETFIPGTQFVDERSGDILDSESCTDKKASGGTVSIKQKTDIDDYIVLGKNGWEGKLSLKLYDTKGIYACSDIPTDGKKPVYALDFNRIFLDNNGKSHGVGAFGNIYNRIPFTKGNKCSLEAEVLTTSDCTEDSSTICLKNEIWEDDIYVGIKGDERIPWIKFGLLEDFSIYKDNNKVFSIKMDEKAECVNIQCCYDKDNSKYFLFWKPNGDQAYVPYMLNSNQFRVIVSNNSCWDAEVYARVWDSKGRVIDNVYLGKIGKNSVKIFTGDYIFKKAQKELPTLGKGASPLYSTILTVGAPKRDVEFAGYDNRFGKTKMIPVYDLNAHVWSYRNVDFDTDTFTH